jgi:hypothetical protein
MKPHPIWTYWLFLLIFQHCVPSGRIHIITGPNYSGKSIYIKQVIHYFFLWRERIHSWFCSICIVLSILLIIFTCEFMHIYFGVQISLCFRKSYFRVKFVQFDDDIYSLHMHFCFGVQSMILKISLTRVL